MNRKGRDCLFFRENRQLIRSGIEVSSSKYLYEVFFPQSTEQIHTSSFSQSYNKCHLKQIPIFKIEAVSCLHCFCLDIRVQMKTRPSSVQLFSHVAYLQGNGIYKVIKSYFLVLPTDHKFYMIFMAFQSLMMQEEILQGLNRIHIFKSVVLWSFLERRGCSLFPGCFLKPRILYVSLFITLRLFLAGSLDSVWGQS